MAKPSPNGWHWLGATLGLATGYVIAGKLGLLFAIPPGMTTAAWPPSGLALAAVLMFGNRVWPGIVLGSLLANWGTVSLHPSPSTPSLLVAMVVAGGAALQALLGANLVRRAGLYPSPLDEAWQVGKFLLLGGPVACLLNATLAVCTMELAGVIAAGTFTFQWWTWWVGDTVGVLAFTPLVLVWGGEPRVIWRQRRFSMTIPLAFTFALAVVLYLLAIRGGHRDWQAWAILALGLLFTALLGAFLLTITGRTAQVEVLEALVSARTEGMNKALLEAQAHSQELEELDQTVQAINQEMHLKGMLDALLRALVSHFPQADFGVFLLRDETDGNFRIAGKHGMGDPIPLGFYFTPEEIQGRYMFGSEALGGGVYLVRPHAMTPGQSKVPEFSKIKSLLAMSVEIRGELAGILVLDNLRDPEAFRETDVAKLHRFREHIISALNKLRTLHDLERTKELALEAARAKGHFLANMSHEIRTPMNAILGFAGLGLKQDSPAKAREYFQKIANSGKSLLGVINDILDFSKIEAGKLELETVPFDLPEVLANIADLFAHMAMEKGIELIVSAGTQVPRQLQGDPLRLAQVLTNLTGNALKFTEHGQVHLRVDVFEKANDLAHLHFAVTDSGIGISPEQQAQVFSAFSQADSSNTRRFGGTGLGLSISKRLVEMMGGELFVQSEFGVGSTFAFSLHLPYDPAQPDSVRHAPGDLIGMKVLVVDDNEITRTVLVEQLRAFGFEVKAVPSAETALEALAVNSPEGPFGLILLDWRMPEMDGVEALRRIQAIPNSPQPKIILCTAFGQDNLQREAESMEVAGFLPKPLSSARLLDGVLAGLGRQESTSMRVSARPSSKGLPSGLRGIRVLLVEDNPINQQVASEILASEGILVQVASSGREAIQAVDHGTFDAVLMDIQMPDMDGYETTARIREKSQHLDLPIIAMTAHALQGYREECLAAGMNDFLTKPVDPNTLFQVLAKWLPTQDGLPAFVPSAKADASKSLLPHAVPGIDVRAGLLRLGGKEGLFLRLVADFARDCAGAGAEIRKAVATQDHSLAERLVHTLKGVAGNLSATELQASAAGLEAALRGNWDQDVSAALEAVEASLAMTLEGARTLEAGQLPVGGTGSEGAPSEEAAALFETLGQQLVNHDPRAEDSLEHLRRHLREPGLQHLLQAMGDCLGGYDFKGASSYLLVLGKAMRDDS